MCKITLTSTENSYSLYVKTTFAISCCNLSLQQLENKFSGGWVMYQMNF